MANGCKACLIQQDAAIPLGRQWDQHPGYAGPDARYSCARCMQAQGRQHGFPDLSADNVEAWELYQMLATQQRVGMDVLALDATTIPMIFDLYEVPEERRRLLFEKLLIIDQEVCQDRQRRRAIEAAQRKGRQGQGGPRRLDVD